MCTQNCTIQCLLGIFEPTQAEITRWFHFSMQDCCRHWNLPSWSCVSLTCWGQSRAGAGTWRRECSGRVGGSCCGWLGQLVLSDTGSQVVSVVASKGGDKRWAGKRGHPVPASLAPVQVAQLEQEDFSSWGLVPQMFVFCFSRPEKYRWAEPEGFLQDLRLGWLRSCSGYLVSGKAVPLWSSLLCCWTGGARRCVGASTTFVPLSPCRNPAFIVVQEWGHRRVLQILSWGDKT